MDTGAVMLKHVADGHTNSITPVRSNGGAGILAIDQHTGACSIAVRIASSIRDTQSILLKSAPKPQTLVHEEIS